MKSPGEIWRQRLWIWVPALLFFLANAGAFAYYTLGYAGQIGSLDRELKDQASRLKDLKDKNLQMTTMIDRVETNERQVEQLYSTRLSTRIQGLTSVSTEFRKMAQQAGLIPKTISYTEEEIEQHGLIKRTYAFSVQGTYAELRKFISLLETSRSFFTVDSIMVANATEGQELRIDLALSTLFSRDPQNGPAVPPPAAAGSTAGSSSSSAAGSPGGSL